MNRTIILYCIVCVLFLTVSGRALPAREQAAPGTAVVAQETAVLDVEHEIERTLAAKEEHIYRVSLKKGELARVVIEQRGIDVVVHLRAHHGEPIADFQDDVRPHGWEQVDVVADEDGDYALAITPAAGIMASGSYGIRLTERRTATDGERSMLDVRRLRTSAIQLQEQST